MSFKLPKLPYSYNDFEPYIDKKTMDIHYNKHHATYTSNLNQAISNTSMINLSIIEILKRAHIESPIIRNNGGGFYNHNLFWEILIPHTKYTHPSREFNEIIQKNFDSFDSFKDNFSKVSAKHFGSGWTWLCVKDEKLTICSTKNQDNPLMYGMGCEGIPILGLDIWEHAYYLQYQNRRLDYIYSFWKIVNWIKVEENYKKNKKINNIFFFVGKIVLENIKLFGFHGCMPEEKYVGSHYTIYLEIEFDFHQASTNDDLSKTINYVDLYSIIKKEMNINSKLIEHLAQRIIQRIKEYKKPLIKNTKIKICKENPPLQGNVDRVCIILDD